MEHRRFQIEAYEQSPGKWRALVRHADWAVVRYGSHFSLHPANRQRTML